MSTASPVEFLREAVAIDSSTDAGPMRSFLRATLEASDIAVTVDDAGTVCAHRGPADAGTHLLLNTHLDTVPPHIPPRWDPQTQTLHGRGSADAKGPLAAMVDAFTGATLPAAVRVTLAVTTDEEVHSRGAAALDVGQTMAIVGEPTDLTLATAARGRFVATVRLAGTAGHAATPAECVNPLEAVGPAVAAIHGMDAAGPTDPLLGAPVATVTQVTAGGAANRVPAAAELTVDRRSIPPETAAAFEERLQTVVAAAVPPTVGVTATLADRPTPFLTAFHTPPTARVVQLLEDALRATGTAPERTAFAAATEASYFAETPVVVFGPGRLADAEGPIAHAEREYVHAPAVETAAVVLRAVIESLGAGG
jgi:Acetylornithine deacetylase/Succinyl-diaminopimelate desuccinylase and related deacylases